LAGCLLLPSSDESEDEDSFFCLLANAGDSGTTLFLAAVAATGAENRQYHFGCNPMKTYL
jgi:hypothetical protein